MRRHRLAVLAVAAALASTVAACGGGDDDENAGSTATTATGSAAGSTTQWPVIPAPSLEGNLLGDPAELAVSVWLPPSYGTSTQRYPVVYFLAGFGESASTAPIAAALEPAIAAGEAPEMIVVGVSGANSLGGAFYVDSPVSGNWATAIHDDLVTAIDDQYRTIADPASRGIAGFSMGGFGALDLAMRHPDVFGSVAALSPGLFAPGGMETTEMFDDPATIEGFLTMQDDVAATGEMPADVTSSVRFSLAYGSAFAPDVEAGPPWVAYPYTTADGPPDPEIWATWESGYGGIADEVEQFGEQLLQLRGIAVDVGLNDQYTWIPEGTAYYVEQLQANGITVDATTHEGGHGPVGQRASEVIVPFFAAVLVTDP